MRRCLLVVALTAWCAACVFPERELDGLACSQDERCGEGYSCQGGTCVADGTDAAALLRDRSLDDTDAPDRVTVDAGRADAVQADSSQPDGSSHDAAELDAAVTDTAQLDGEVDDASLLSDASLAPDAAAPDLGATPDTSVETDVEPLDVPSPHDTADLDIPALPDMAVVMDAAAPRDAGDDDPTADLVAAFPFSEGSGTTTHDAIGALTGTITGATWTPDGKAGNGLSFDGDDQVALAPASALLALEDGTLCVWLKRTGGGSANVMSAVNSGQNPRLHIYIAGGDLVVLFETWQGSGHSAVFQAEMTYPADGLWHHVAYSAEDGVGSTFYLDGAAVTPSYTVGDASASVFLAAPGGGASVTLGNQLVGSLDEVRFYDRPLTQTEVQFDMAYVPR